MQLVRTLGRVAWSAGAAALLGLAVAWIALGLVAADAYGAQKAIDHQRGGAPSAYDWATLTADPFLDSLFWRVFAAAGGGLFLAFTAGLWTGAVPREPGLGVPRAAPRPADAEVRPRPDPTAAGDAAGGIPSDPEGSAKRSGGEALRPTAGRTRPKAVPARRKG